MFCNFAYYAMLEGPIFSLHLILFAKGCMKSLNHLHLGLALPEVWLGLSQIEKPVPKVC